MIVIKTVHIIKRKIPMELTLNDIQEYLGQTGKKEGDEVVFQCGVCALSGQDKSRNNLKWNTKKNVLYCFKDSEHSKIIMSEIMKKKHEEKKMSNVEIPKYVKCQERYIYYQIFCNDMLLGKFNKDLLDEMLKIGMCDKKEYETHIKIANTDKPLGALEYLYKSRGIGKQAVEECGIGVDFFFTTLGNSNI